MNSKDTGAAPPSSESAVPAGRLAGNAEDSADGEKCAQAAIDAVFKKQATPPAP